MSGRSQPLPASSGDHLSQVAGPPVDRLFLNQFPPVSQIIEIRGDKRSVVTLQGTGEKN